jgi:hypothetical protein
MKDLNKTNTPRTFAGVALIASALLVGCELPGSSPSPTVEQVKAWREKVGKQPAHTVTSLAITNLSCTKAPEEEIERTKAGYKVFGANADDVIASYAQCSYTIDVEFKGAKGPWIKGQDYKVAGFRMTDELWLLGAHKGKEPEWQGKMGWPEGIKSHMKPIKVQ